MGLTIQNVQIDVPSERYDETVAFWGAALSASPPPVADPAFTHLAAPTAQVGVHLQRLRSAGDQAGIHLDLVADDVPTEVARLEGLGATWLRRWETVEVLADPAGLPFCVVAHRSDERLTPRDPRRAFLDAVVLDVAPAEQQPTADFWAAALGVEPFVANEPGSPYLWSDGLRSTGGPFELGVQRLGDAAAGARIHLDTIAVDVLAEVARLTGLGAKVVAELPRWTVLADPVGNLLCVVAAPEDGP